MVGRTLFSLSFLSFALFCPASLSSHEEVGAKHRQAPLQSWPSMGSLVDIPDDATPASLTTPLTKKGPSRDNTGVSLTDYHQKRGGFFLSSHRDPSPTDRDALTSPIEDGKIKPNPPLLKKPYVSPRFPPRVRGTSEPLTALKEEA
jgi:hypothetical protein